MGRRGKANWKATDMARALKTAREGGVEPGMVEVVVAPDGSRSFRVYAAGAVVPPSPTPDGIREVMSAAEWDAEFAKLDAKKAEKKAAKK